MKKFTSFPYIIIFFSLSNILEANTKQLEQQYQKMQQWHKEKQQLQAHLEEIAEVYYIE